MNLFRLLIFAALVWLLVRLVKSLKSVSPGPSAPGPKPGGEKLTGGELVQDPHCGVYIPKESAVRGSGGEYFCSVDCRDAHRKKGG